MEDRVIAPNLERQLLHRSSVTWSAPLQGGLAPLSASFILKSCSSKFRLSSEDQYGSLQSSPKKFSSYRALAVSVIDESTVLKSDIRVLGRVLFPVRVRIKEVLIDYIMYVSQNE